MRHFHRRMVDRITPATTVEDIAAWLAQDQGYTDPACVMHEAFRQWVIEDDFRRWSPGLGQGRRADGSSR